MPPTDEEEIQKARKRMLEEAEDEQKRIEAEEEARRLEAEGRKAADDAQRIMREEVEFLKKSFKEIEDEHKKMMSRMTDDAAGDFAKKWGPAVRKVADTTTAMLSEAINRSVKNSLDSTNVGDLQPGFGRVGRAAAQSMGETFGTALGTMITGNPIVGKLIGQVVGAAAGPLYDAAAMQLEGYNMLGAKVAPIVTAGKGNEDFEKMGRDYRMAVMQIVRDTGATADMVGATANALSKLGFGFNDATKGEVQFALATDRMLNLQPGTTLKLQTEIVTKYGESLFEARVATKEMAEGVADFTIAQKDNRNAIAGTFAAGQTLSESLAQISSQARNSGASLESMNNISMGLIKTMATGGGQGMMRPDQIVASGGRLLGGLMPTPQGSIGAEARRSGIDRMLLEKSEAGRSLRDRIMAEGDSLGMSSKDRNLYFETLSSMHMTGAKGREESQNMFLAQLQGVNSIISEKGWGAAAAMLQDRGMGGQELVMARQMFSDLNKRGAFEPGADASGVLRGMLKEKQGDPRFKQMMDNFTGAAEKQGQAMQSSMDKIGNKLTELSVFFNQEYWTQARDAFADVFGMEDKPSLLGMVGRLAGVLGGDPTAISAAASGTSAMIARGNMDPGPSTAPMTRRQEMSISDSSMSVADDNKNRNRSSMGVTGQ
jgi:hypothetical protein